MAMTYLVTIEPAGKDNPANRFQVSWENIDTGNRDYFEQSAEITNQEAEELWQDKEHQLAIGQKLFRLLDGDSRLFELALKEASGMGEKLEIRLSTCPETADWPFELLVHEEKFLLTHRVHLVRFVSDHGINKEVSPEKRPLKLLFMASSALDVNPELDFELEEESIFQATGKLPIHMEVEDSGSLNGLREQLLTEKFDVVHLSGHAGTNENDAPFFIMENESGRRKDIFPDTLWNDGLIENPPRLLFLSGCRTGQSIVTGESDPPVENPDAVSFARRLVEQHNVPAVLGWGRSVSDNQASLATKMLYRELSRGKSILDAVQRARIELCNIFPDEDNPAWPMLRLFSSGISLIPIVSRGQKLRPKPRKLKHVFFRNSNIKILEEGFIGRRRQLQASFRSLSQDIYKVGILLLGAGGLGKSCLAGKICERFLDHTVIPIQGKLSPHTMKQALSDAFITAQDENGQQILDRKEDFNKQLADLCATSFKENNYLILLDDFDQNLEQPRSGKPGPLTLEAVKIMKTLLHYLPFSGKMTQIIITSRCGFTLTEQNRDLAAEYLENIWLTSFLEAEQRKKLRGLNYISNIPQRARQSKLLTAGFGNPLLMEKLNQMFGEMKHFNPDELNAAIKRTQMEFTMDSQLYQIVNQCPADFLRFLRRISIYRRPVEEIGMELVAVDAGIENWRELLAKGLKLGFIELDGARETYMVSPLLRSELLAQLDETKSCHKAAFEYYRQRCSEEEWLGIPMVEECIFHSSSAKKEAELFTKGIDVVNQLDICSTFPESRLAEEAVVADRVKDIGIEPFMLSTQADTVAAGPDGHLLAIMQLEQALNGDKAVYGACSPAVARKLSILAEAWRALGKYDRVVEYYLRVLEIDEAIYGSDHEYIAATNQNLGTAYMQLNRPDEAKECFEKAYLIFSKELGHQHPRTIELGKKLQILPKA